MTQNTPADIEAQRMIYRLWSGIYDPVYTHLFSNAHRISAHLAAEAGPRILEVGFGTGLLLNNYPAPCDIYGIDLSNAMLKVAAKKIPQAEARVGGLCVMDAARLAFENETFDVVLFPFVIALVQNSEAALDEALRVLKPGGRIVIANRFGAEEGLQEKFENMLQPLVASIGWSCNFKISRVARWAASRSGISYQGKKFGHYFKVIMLQKSASA